MPDVDPATVPGFREAVAALDGLTEGTISPSDVGRIVSVVMAVTRPHVQAEAFADASDHLAEHGHVELADVLDSVSYQMRQVIHGE